MKFLIIFLIIKSMTDKNNSFLNICIEKNIICSRTIRRNNFRDLRANTGMKENIYLVSYNDTIHRSQMNKYICFFSSIQIRIHIRMDLFF